MTWTVIAPAIGVLSAARWLWLAGRRWRRDDAELSDLTEEVAFAGLWIFVGSTAALHPTVAAVFIAGAVFLNAKDVKELVAGHRARALPRTDPPDDSG